MHIGSVFPPLNGSQPHGSCGVVSTGGTAACKWQVPWILGVGALKLQPGLCRPAYINRQPQTAHVSSRRLHSWTHHDMFSVSAHCYTTPWRCQSSVAKCIPNTIPRHWTVQAAILFHSVMHSHIQSFQPMACRPHGSTQGQKEVTSFYPCVHSTQHSSTRIATLWPHQTRP